MKLPAGIIVHRGRAHVDDFLAASVCAHHTKLPIFRMDSCSEMLGNPDFWVLDQGLEFDPSLHNFDHHHLKDKTCALTMLLDHLYPNTDYRQYMPQLEYIEIHDSVGSAKAGRFANLPYEGLEIASSVVQQLMLKSFSRIDGIVPDPLYSVMLSMGAELCGRIEEVPFMLAQLDSEAEILEHVGLMVLDVTGCQVSEPDRLPTKSWCERRGVHPSVILTRDARAAETYRMISLDRSVRFVEDPDAKYAHPSGFLTVFENLDDWRRLLSMAVAK